MADEKQLEELSAKVNALSEGFANIGETITNAVTGAMKPLQDHVDQIAANQKAEDDAKRATAVNALTKSGQWEESDLEGMSLAALNKLVEKTRPGKAAALNGAFDDKSTDDDEWKGYSMNSLIDGDKGKEAH